MQEEGVRYFKGHERIEKEDGTRTSGRCAFFKITSEPQEQLFGDPWTVEASFLEKTGLTHYSTVEEAEKDFYIQREISQQEYEIYESVQTILTEIFMNQFTGGFPRMENVRHNVRRLDRLTHKFNPTDMSIANALALMFANQLRNDQNNENIIE